MRIVFSNYDSPANPFYGGGGAGAIHEVARRLAAAHEVSVVVGAYPGSRSGLQDGVSYDVVGPATAGPRLGQLLFHFSLPMRLRRRAFDVWCESLTPPFSTACLQLWTRRPVVALTQILAGAGMQRKYRLPFHRVERLGLRTYRWAIATSHPAREQLLEANPRLRIEVIPNGVSGEWVRCEPRKTERHILFMGRWDIEQKGLDLLLDALGGLARPLPFPLVVAGGGTPREEAFLRGRLAALGLTGRVRLVGRVAGATKQRLFEEAVMLVMPSRFEASPLVVFEAFCQRVPVVLFGIRELADLPEDAVVRVPPFEVAGLGEAVRALAEDPERRERLGRAAKAYVRRFDWDDLAARYAAFLSLACGAGPVPPSSVDPGTKTTKAAEDRGEL